MCSHIEKGLQILCNLSTVKSHFFFFFATRHRDFTKNTRAPLLNAITKTDSSAKGLRE